MRPAVASPIDEYRGFGDKCRENLDQSLTGNEPMHIESMRLIDAVDAWAQELRARPEQPMLETAIRELRFAVLACAQGQYRQAFFALRMALELSVAAMFFSTREVELREWLGGKLDIKWGLLVDEKDGVFSERFVKAFCPPLVQAARQAGGIAVTAYRECSEFVHGGPDAATRLPAALDYDEVLLRDWHRQLGITLIPITFAMMVRYGAYPSIIGTAAATAAVRATLSGVKPAMALIGEDQ